MDDAHGTLQRLRAQMPAARPDHDLNHVELSGRLNTVPERSTHWVVCELKVRTDADHVLFVRLHLNPTLAQVLDGVPLGTRLAIGGRLAFSRLAGGTHLVVVQELQLLPAGVTLSRER